MTSQRLPQPCHSPTCLSLFLMCLSWHSVAESSKSGTVHMVRSQLSHSPAVCKSSSQHSQADLLLLWHWLLSWSSHFKTAFMIQSLQSAIFCITVPQVTVTSALLPDRHPINTACTLLQIHFHPFYTSQSCYCSRPFTFITVFRKFFEPNTCFTVKWFPTFMILSSSYPSIFWLAGSFPSGIAASHSFHFCITVSCCVSGDLL